MLASFFRRIFEGNVSGTESKDSGQQSDQTINAYDILPYAVDQEHCNKKKCDTMKDPFPSVPSSDIALHCFSPLDLPVNEKTRIRSVKTCARSLSPNEFIGDAFARRF
jgi:hypothetical protein